MDFRTIFNIAVFGVLFINCIIELAILKLVEKIEKIARTEAKRHMGTYSYRKQEQEAPKGIDFPNSRK